MSYADSSSEAHSSPPPSETQPADQGGGAPTIFPAFGRAIAALTYALLYNFVYEVYLFPQFEYFGFRNYEDSLFVISLGIGAVVLAAMGLPGKIRVASDFCSWSIFILIYVPAIITIAKSGTLRDNGAEILIASLLASQLLLSTIPRFFRIREMALPSLRGIASPSFLSTVCLIFSAVLVARFYGIMSLAGFDDIYIQRENASIGEAGFIFGYIVLWQTYALAPLLIAAAFYSGNRFYLIPPVISLVVIYLITAAKITIFIYAIIFFVYVLSRLGAFRRPTMLMLIAVGPLAIGALLFLLLGSVLEGPLMIGTSVIIMRGIAVQGMLTNLYAEFFVNNPYTFFSHINIVSYFVDYPYEEPLSVELSYYLIGNGNAGANSSFWSTDGIAAGGSLGVVIIGIVVGLIFVVMNSLMRGVDIVFASLSLMPFVMALANVSVFTTLLSAGGLIVFLLAAPLFDRLRELASQTRHRRLGP